MANTYSDVAMPIATPKATCPSVTGNGSAKCNEREEAHDRKEHGHHARRVR